MDVSLPLGGWLPTVLSSMAPIEALKAVPPCMLLLRLEDGEASGEDT